MEAVPRLPMICFDLKCSTDTAHFGPKLKQYIRDFYNEDPETYSNEIQQLESLRGAAVRPGRDVAGVATLKRYYCQLHFLMSRFPMNKDGAAAVVFSWRDIYANLVVSLPDIQFEIVSILYNIGALHTQLGMSDTRTTEDGMKMACTHFQCAAWAFQHLKDTYPQSTEGDVAPDIMQFAYHLCLAQAQECILEKSMMDNRKASIIVKVAVQVVNYYSQAFNALKHAVSEESVGPRVYTGWRRLAKFKEIYYRCVIQLFQGMQAEEQRKMGERVAFYQLAHDTLEEAVKLSKNLDKAEMNPKQVQEALSFTMDVVEGKRKAAKNENEYIYHEGVPDRDQLPKAMGVALVKGIPFSVNDAEVSGPDIFGRLVPMKAHEASSLYSEEKAKLLRKVGGMIEEKDQSLIAFLSSLQLEHLNSHSEPDRLPQELVDRCAALSAKPEAIQNLIDSMSKLSDVCVEVENMLKEIQELLEEEEALEKGYQAVMGKRPPSIVATDMTREAAKYQEAHAKANESNQALHKVMITHISNLRILALPLAQLHQQIPSLPTFSDPESESIVKEMQALMNKVEEMRNQRVMLATQLRESICKDDITQLLITHQNDNMENIFQQELKKHQDIVKLIQQNLAAQDNILKAVTDAYARYGSVRKSTAEAVRRRQSVINALISCFDAYEDLLAKSAKGHEFYNKLETNVSKLLVRVRSSCKVQQEEREQMLAKNSASFSKKSINRDSEKSVNELPKGQNAPKLKDYLKKDTGSGNMVVGGYNNLHPGAPTSPAMGVYGPGATPSPAPSAGYYDSVGGVTSCLANISVDGKPQNWIPGVRPAPVGSEATTSVMKIEPTEAKPEVSAAFPYSAPPTASTGLQYAPGGYSQYADQAYSYAGTGYGMHSWGYGNLASTMSTYIPSNVQYPSDTSISGEQRPVSSDHADLQISNQQGHRFDPAGAASFDYGSNCHNQQLAPPVAPQPGVGGTVGYQGNQSSLSSNFSQLGSISAYPITQSPAVGYQYNQTSATSDYQNSKTNLQNTASLAAVNYQNLASPSAANYQVPNMGQGLNYQAGTSNALDNFQPKQGFPSNNSSSMYPSQQPGTGSQLSATGSTDYQSTLASGQAAYQSTLAPGQAAYQSIGGAPNGSHFSGAYDPVNSSSYYGSYSNTYPDSYTQQQQGAWPAQVSPAHNSACPASSTTTTTPLSSVSYYTNMYSHPSSSVAYQAPGSMSSEYQYMANQNVSCYSNAGHYPTQQTSSSYSSQAVSYNVPTTESSSSLYAPGSYYQVPYGYQYPATVPSAVIPIPSTPGPQQGQGSQSMYMQARMPNSNPATTNSPQASRSSSVEASNIDLLAGLDFTVNQQPLVPQHDGTISNVPPPAPIPSAVTETKPQPTNQSSDKMQPNTPPNLLSDPVVVKSESLSDHLNVLSSPENTLNKTQSLKSAAKDPFQDPETLTQFTQEVEKYEKFVEGLTSKTLNGPTPLDMKWKELLELQEKDSHKQSISVARCYPMKNRFPDILPYDCSRVELPSTKDDYINASYMKDLTPSTPPFIVTQAPLPSTYADFWVMVYEQQVEVIACLLNDSELDGQVYWPMEKGKEMMLGRMRLSLQTSNLRQHWIERIISLSDAEARITRVIIHLQFTDWPGSSFPASPGPFLAFVSECLAFHSQQRVISHPIVVHCLSGVGRTGLFCLTCASICELMAGHGLIDLVSVTANMSERRKGALRDREHLKFAYQALLYYAQDLLMKRGILTSGSSFEDKRGRTDGKCHTRHPSQDFLLGPPTGLSQLQSGIEKMGLDAARKSDVGASALTPVEHSQKGNAVDASHPMESPKGIDQDSQQTSVSSSRKSSSGSSHLTDLSELGIHLSTSESNTAKKGQSRFTPETFKKGNSTLETPHPSPDDPLSCIDPLWPLKRF